ncbi:penicillin-binding protein 1A [Flexibacter flexilis DSM 6793]|uniref:Penicillin-binding protein 1A n=2 Tax=Flexibacter flexilis TaxID=998 RepID=A0A1I1J6V4_9BACT|nr:penicillin-binding protein 1A [Flexibacter flexilis DSM 6793]
MQLWDKFVAYRKSKREKYKQMSKPQRNARRLWKAAIFLMIGVVGYIKAVEHNFLWLFGGSPSMESLQRPKFDIPSEVYTADGKLVGKYFKENRTPVEYNKISPFVVKALLATEDIRFYEHTGIDPEALVSVLYSALRGDNRGGSTITQQLAKNLYKIRTEASQGMLANIKGLSTIIAKTKEWITSVKLENTYTKEEVMTMYLNTVDFGSNSFGIKAAAKTFFNTSPDSLRVEEAAMLVGMLKATTSYNPRKNYENAMRRRNTVLGQMLKYNFVSQKSYDSLTKLPITLKITESGHFDGPLDYYGNYLTGVLKTWGEGNNADIYTDGLKIYLTVDSRMQQHAQEAIAEHMKDLQKKFDRHWKGRNPWVSPKGNSWEEIPHFIEDQMAKTPYYKMLVKRYDNNLDSVNAVLNRPHKMVVFNWSKPEGDTVEMSAMDSLRYYKRILHAGLMTIDPFTGHIKAWQGGIDYHFFKYDHVKQSRRQPGSTFKPFVYAAAIDQGQSPCFKIQDVRRSYQYREKSHKTGADTTIDWSPQNAARSNSGGMMTLRYAMGRSINSIAVQLTEMLGAKFPTDLNHDTITKELHKLEYLEPFPEILYGASVVRHYAQKLGISSPLRITPSIGLGSNDVTLYEMVGAYASFVNNGMWTRPMMVSRIEDRNGNVIKQFNAYTKQAVSPETAFLMVYMLKGTLQEPGGTAQGLWGYHITRGNELAGKTGTSSNQSDGWFMGVTHNLVTGVWVGADERSIHFRELRQGEGSKTALPIYGLFMERIYEDKSLGIKPGFFPTEKKAGIVIRQKYKCPTPYPKKVVDTTSTDSATTPAVTTEIAVP